MRIDLTEARVQVSRLLFRTPLCRFRTATSGACPAADEPPPVSISGGQLDYRRRLIHLVLINLRPWPSAAHRRADSIHQPANQITQIGPVHY